MPSNRSRKTCNAMNPSLFAMAVFTIPSPEIRGQLVFALVMKGSMGRMKAGA